MTITATGLGFVPTDSIRINPADATAASLPTTFVSSTVLTAPVAASALASGAVAFTVGDPAAGTSSQAVAYAAAPAIASLSPSSAVAGGPAFTLTVTGSGFDSTCTVMWNGAPRAHPPRPLEQRRTSGGNGHRWPVFGWKVPNGSSAGSVSVGQNRSRDGGCRWTLQAE